MWGGRAWVSGLLEEGRVNCIEEVSWEWAERKRIVGEVCKVRPFLCCWQGLLYGMGGGRCGRREDSREQPSPANPASFLHGPATGEGHQPIGSSLLILQWTCTQG